MTTVLVASTGGHLAQLYALRRTLVPAEQPVHWITFDTPQSRSMLRDESVSFVPFTAPRDFANVARNASTARKELRSVGAKRVVSTGSAIALSYLPVAAAMGLGVEYIESAARSVGPSLTGRILARVPRIKTFTQYRSWSSAKWQYRYSVFDDYVPSRPTPVRLKRVVVSLGTLDYPFDRLVRRLCEVLPGDVEVVWQAGGTDISQYGLQGHGMMPEHELRGAVENSQLLIAHAGCGAALLALDAGKVPVLVPRRRSHGEHVDDHQVQIARELAGRDLAVFLEADEITLSALEQAAQLRVVRVSAGHSV